MTMTHPDTRSGVHVCDTGSFSRSTCPEPCGAMHSYCASCGKRQDPCAHDTGSDPTTSSEPGDADAGEEALTGLVAVLGHDDWCDYEECEEFFGCSVWQRARALLSSSWFAAQTSRPQTLTASAREEVRVQVRAEVVAELAAAVTDHLEHVVVYPRALVYADDVLALFDDPAAALAGRDARVRDEIRAADGSSNPCRPQDPDLS